MVRFIVPVKHLNLSKSRLHVPMRRQLVVAMLRDTVEALLAADAGPVTVVTPDEYVRDLARALHLDVLDSALGLNAAITAALRPGTCAAVLPDLPALRPADVHLLVGQAGAFVPDAAGTGTTMAIADPLRPVFGRGSARAFSRQGLRRISAAATARTDVDTATDLAACAALGLGRHTAAVWAAAGPWLPDRPL